MRRRQGRARSADAGAGCIRLGQPLDLDATLGSGQTFRWRPLESGWQEGVLGSDIVRLRHRGDVLEVSGGPSPLDDLVGRVRSHLRLEDDLPAILRLVSVDQHVEAAIERYPGLRLLRTDPWECLASFLLSAASNIPRVSRTVEALASTYGQRIQAGDSVRYTFPTPGDLAQATEAGLLALGVGYRAPYLVGTAQAVAEGRVDLAALRGAPYDEARAALLALPGVGDKVADCVLLHSQEKSDAFPVDRWVRRALAEWYGLDARLSYAKVRTWAVAHFGPWAGYAELYLFHRRRRGGR